MKPMITVIIAGGSGTRLWPLSTDSHPKQLLSVTGERSLLQQTFDRAERLGGEIFILTEASHAEQAKAQLPELAAEYFLVEPGRRGTAHCILFALDVIARTRDHDEPIAFIHADHHIRDTSGFVASFKIAAQESTAKQHIALIGIEPSFAATTFGYIERSATADENTGVCIVNSFKEKPSYDIARQYVKSGKYLWNCGYFVGSVNIFKKEMQNNAPLLNGNFEELSAIEPFNGQAYQEKYLSFDNQVIDIALIEKSNNLLVVPARFDWMDVGSFRDLHDAVEQDMEGNYQQGNNIFMLDVENSYVRNEESQKPIAVIGLDNVVVVNTPDGILISRKDLSPRVGEVAKILQAQQSKKSTND